MSSQSAITTASTRTTTCTSIDDIWQSLKEECSVGTSAKTRARAEQISCLWESESESESTSNRNLNRTHATCTETTRSTSTRRRENKPKKRRGGTARTRMIRNRHSMQSKEENHHRNQLTVGRELGIDSCEEIDVDDGIDVNVNFNVNVIENENERVEDKCHKKSIHQAPIFERSGNSGDDPKNVMTVARNQSIVLGDSDDETDDDDDDEEEEESKSTATIVDEPRQNSKHCKRRLERLASMLQSSDVKDRLDAMDNLTGQIEDICNRMTTTTTVVPELNYPLPYDIERISLTHRQYDATVSDLAKGKYVSDWDRWQRTHASLLDQFPDKRSGLHVEQGEGQKDALGIQSQMEEEEEEEEEEEAAAQQKNQEGSDATNAIAMTADKATLQAIMDICGSALFRKFSDPSERCRLGALKCVQLLCLSGLNMSRHIAYLMPAIFSRVQQPAEGTYYDEEMKVFVSNVESHAFYKRGGATVRQDRETLISSTGMMSEISQQTILQESCEEVRLGICELLRCILRSCVYLNTTSLLDAYFTDIILILHSYLKDPFPDLKVAASHLLCQVVRLPCWESGAKYFATALSRAVLPNLRHRSSKVRIVSIQLFESTVSVPDREKIKGAGTEAIADLVGFQEENVLPIAAFYKSECGITVNCLAELVTDSNVNVRRRCCEMLSFFCCALPDRYDHHLRILPYLIAALTDENRPIREIALRSVDICGQQYEAENPNDIIERRQYGVDGDNRCNHVDPLPPPFVRRPRIGARLFVRGNSKRFFAALLHELCDWKPSTCLRSAKLIHILAIYCEEHLTMDFQNTLSGIVKALQRCLCKDDKESCHLQDTLEKLLTTIGRYVDPDTYVKLLLPRILGDAESGTTFSEGGIHSDLSCATNALALRCLIRGTLPRRVLSHLFVLVPALCSPKLVSCYVGPRVKKECLETLKVLFDRVKNNSIAGAQTAHFEATGRLHSSKRIIMDCKVTLVDLLKNEDDKTIVHLGTEIIKSIPKDFMEHSIYQTG